MAMARSLQRSKPACEVIAKPASALSKTPNLSDYERECAGFTWQGAWKLLDGLPGGRGFNMAHEAVDRHAAGGRADKLDA